MSGTTVNNGSPRCEGRPSSSSARGPAAIKQVGSSSASPAAHPQEAVPAPPTGPSTRPGEHRRRSLTLGAGVAGLGPGSGPLGLVRPRHRCPGRRAALHAAAEGHSGAGTLAPGSRGYYFPRRAGPRPSSPPRSPYSPARARSRHPRPWPAWRLGGRQEQAGVSSAGFTET